jgi:glycerate dehydrogenase
MRIVILDSFTTDQGNPSLWDDFRNLGEVHIHSRTLPEDVAKRCADADIIITNKIVLSERLLGLIGPKLRYIGLMGTGTNAVDLAAAERHGIVVSNIPDYSTDSVAQLVFALVLHFTHDVAGHNADVKAGKWAECLDFFFMRQTLTELRRKILVIVGKGAIGSAVGRIAEAFGMEVFFARVPGSLHVADRVPLEEALPKADFVSLHCPLNEETRNLVDRKFLSAMKPSAILINTGRGGLIHESDLIEALDQSRIGGVGLDVLSKEPPPKDHPLLNPNALWAHKVVITPHLGWATVEARTRAAERAVENLRAFLKGEPINRVA